MSISEMKPNSIVFTSKNGNTQKYAYMLGEQISLPVYSLEQAYSKLSDGCPIIYLGWIHASHVKGYSKAAKHFTVRAVLGVGLCDTGTLLDEVRSASSIPESITLFTLQGGFNRSKLKGMDKILISMLIKGLSSKKQLTPQDERMLKLLSKDECYVTAENLNGFLRWYKEQYT